MLELDKEQIVNKIKESLVMLKLDYEEVKDQLCACLYTDGGALSSPVKAAGCGVHGYIYLDIPTNSNSSSPKGYATTKGYVSTKLEDPLYKVTVVTYFDYRDGLGAMTNNFAELSAGLFALNFVDTLQIPKFLILSDSQYFIKHTNEFLSKWVENDFISNGKEIANRDLWEQIHSVWQRVQTRGKIGKVKAHSGDIGNDLADLNATSGINMTLHPGYDGEGIFIHDDPKSFWDRSHGLSPLFTEKRLLLHSEGNDGNLYFQMSMGDQWPNNETDRRSFIGKRIADTCISVVYLLEPEPVIEMLSNFCRNISEMDGLVCARLDLLTKGTLYSEVKQSKTLSLSQSGLQVVTATGVELLSELKPGRLSWRMANQLEWLADMLNSFIADYPVSEERLGFKVINITNNLFTVKELKSSSVYELREDIINDELVTCNVTLYDKPCDLTLTMNVDIPSRVDMKRIAKSSPDVYLLYWSDYDNDDLVYYATVMKVNGEYGIWCSAYSNFHILPKEVK